MPREVFVINEFHGGKDSKTDKRDVGIESSVEQVNIETSKNLASDKRGKVKVAGKFELIRQIELHSSNQSLDDNIGNVRSIKMTRGGLGTRHRIY